MALIHIFLFLRLFSLSPIEGKVLDTETQKPIPYAYIQFLHDEGAYITANSVGEFHFEAVGNRKKGRLYVRALGYEETTLNYDVTEGTFLTIKLKPKAFELPELVVRDGKVISAMLGEKNAITDGMLKQQRNPAILFDLNKEKGQLTKLHFSLSQTNGFPEAPMLVNVYAFKSSAKKPKTLMVLKLDNLKPVHGETITFEGGKAGWNELDLEPYGLQFKNCWVLIHFIYPTYDPRYEWHVETTASSGEKIVRKYFGSSIDTYSSIKTQRLISLIYLEGAEGGELIVSPLTRSNGGRLIPAVALEYDAFK